MKYFVSLITTLFFAFSCSDSPDHRPEQISHTFLSAYFSLDFEQFLPLCCEALRNDLERSAQSVRGLSPETMEKLRNDLIAYSFEIEKIDLNHTKDSAFVSYIIFTPEALNGIDSRLTLIKEENEWRVAKLL